MELCIGWISSIKRLIVCVCLPVEGVSAVAVWAALAVYGHRAACKALETHTYWPPLHRVHIRQPHQESTHTALTLQVCTHRPRESRYESPCVYFCEYVSHCCWIFYTQQHACLFCKIAKHFQEKQNHSTFQVNHNSVSCCFFFCWRDHHRIIYFLLSRQDKLSNCRR